LNDGPNDTPRPDGVKNIVRYALGVPVASPVDSALPQSQSVNVGGVNYPCVTFIRNRNAVGVTVQVTASTDVTFSSLLETVTLPPVNLGNGQERVTVRVLTPVNLTDLVFFHVYVNDMRISL